MKRWLPEFQVSETGDNKLIPSNQSFEEGITHTSSPSFPQSSLDDDDFLDDVEMMEQKPTTKLEVNLDVYLVKSEKHIIKWILYIYLATLNQHRQ